MQGRLGCRGGWSERKCCPTLPTLTSLLGAVEDSSKTVLQTTSAVGGAVGRPWGPGRRRESSRACAAHTAGPAQRPGAPAERVLLGACSSLRDAGSQARARRHPGRFNDESARPQPSGGTAGGVARPAPQARAVLSARAVAGGWQGCCEGVKFPGPVWLRPSPADWRTPHGDPEFPRALGRAPAPVPTEGKDNLTDPFTKSQCATQVARKAWGLRCSRGSCPRSGSSPPFSPYRQMPAC
jgi:hypothetical protein